MMDAGSARLGMIVADMFRRNRKMTATTRPIVNSSVNFTSATESRMASDRSERMSSSTDGGSCSRKPGSSFLMSSTTCTTFVPGCFWTASVIARSIAGMPDF